MKENIDLRGKIRIGVIGGSSVSDEVYKLAEEVGKEIARAGAILVCGGLGGVMVAACKGAKEEGGFTIGILPTRDKENANPYVDIAIPTGLGEGRNMLVVLNSDGIIAIDGAYGTLTEIAYALLYKKPIVGLNTWKISLNGYREEVVSYTEPKEAIKHLLELIKTRPN